MTDNPKQTNNKKQINERTDRQTNETNERTKQANKQTKGVAGMLIQGNR